MLMVTEPEVILMRFCPMQIKLPICYITGTDTFITAWFLVQTGNNLNKGTIEYPVPYHRISYNQRNKLELSYIFSEGLQ